MTNMQYTMPVRVYVYPYDQPGYFPTYTQQPVVNQNEGFLSWCKWQLFKLLMLCMVLTGWYITLYMFCK